MKICNIRSKLEELTEEERAKVFEVWIQLETMFDLTRGEVAVDLLLDVLKKRYGKKLGKINAYMAAMSLYREVCHRLRGEPTSASHVNQTLLKIAREVKSDATNSN